MEVDPIPKTSHLVYCNGKLKSNKKSDPDSTKESQVYKERLSEAQIESHENLKDKQIELVDSRKQINIQKISTTAGETLKLQEKKEGVLKKMRNKFSSVYLFLTKSKQKNSTNNGQSLSRRQLELLDSEAHSDIQKISTITRITFQLSNNKKEALVKLQKKIAAVYMAYKEMEPERAATSEKALNRFIATVANIETIEVPETSSTAQRFKEPTTGIRIIHDPNGKLYAQLNVFIAKGTQNTVKFAIDFHTFNFLFLTEPM